MHLSTIRNRVRVLRDQRGLNQVELADVLGFNDRQTISAIERGERKISAEELVRIADYFGVDIGYFTDPFELAGEGAFSWRRNDMPHTEMAPFEHQAGRWLAIYRHLTRLSGASINSLVPRLGLSDHSTFEDAAAEGEEVARILDLGKIPAESLHECLARELNVLVLHVDAPDDISGAACRLGAMDAILINRHQAAHRRAFNLAHELFHLATWERMPPERMESEYNTLTDRHYRRIEQLANNFAAGLLMPRPIVEALIRSAPVPPEPDYPDWIKALAMKLGVSGQSVKWRLADLGVIKRAAARRLNDRVLGIPGASRENTVPLRFSEKFVEVLGWGIQQGHVSARRAAGLMGMTLDDLAGLFDEHGLSAPFDL